MQALCALLLWVAVDRAGAAEQARAKRVLIISTGSRLSPGFALFDQHILQALEKITSVRIETYAENLDIIRFPPDRVRRTLGEYLTEKYADQPPDLIVLAYVSNLGTAAGLLKELFPATPLILAGLTEEDIRLDQFDSFVSGIAQRLDPNGSAG